MTVSTLLQHATLGKGDHSGTYATLGSGALALAPMYAKMRQALDDVHIILLGDSTADDTNSNGGVGTDDEWPALFLDLLGTQFPNHGLTEVKWGTTSYGTATVRRASSNTRVIKLWNGGKASTSFEYPLTTGNGHWKQATVNAPDAIFINEGHNDSTEARRDRYVMLAEQVRAYWPNVPIILCAQNPRTDGNAATQATRANIVRELCATKGYGLLDLFTPLNEQPNLASLLTADGVHPLPSTHANILAPAVWAQLWAPYAAAGGVVFPGGRPMGMPSLLVPAPSLLAGSDFGTTWDGTSAGLVTLGWTVNGSTTVAKDVTNFERANAYGVKLTKVAANDSISQAIACKHLQAQYVTFAARVFIPTGSAAQIGAANLELNDGVAAATASRVFNGNSPQGKFFWNMVTARVSTTATTLTAKIYVDQTGSGTAATPTIDRVWLGRGDVPHDIL